MTAAENIPKAGDVKIEEISMTSHGKKYDIRALVLETVIYEDIFSNVLSGYIVVRDSASFITQLPISGMEQVKVKFRTPQFQNATIEKTFYVNGVDERILDNTQQLYTINLISTEALTDNVSRISKKFSGSTHDIIKQVYDKYIKDKKELVVLERHNTSTSVVSPFWSPLKLINWVCTRSYNNAPSVLFFEGNKNFYLTSIEDLIRRGVSSIFDTFTYSPTASVDGSRDVYAQFKKILNISPVNYLDVFRAQDFGYYASTLITHDITAKQYNEYTSDQYQYHNKVFNLHDRGNSQTFDKNIPRNPDMFRRVRTKQFNMFEENKDPLYEKWAMQRNSLLYEASEFHITIEVPGRTDMEVGKVINVVIPKSVERDLTKATARDLIDPYLSGNYLVTCIRHSIVLNKHTMHLEIMKDSYQKALN